MVKVELRYISHVYHIEMSKIVCITPIVKNINWLCVGGGVVVFKVCFF